MWIIVAMAIAAGGSNFVMPLAVGPDLLFARHDDCMKGANQFAEIAKEHGLGLDCKFYPVFGGAQQEAL